MTSASFSEVCLSYVCTSIGTTTCDIVLCGKCHSQIAKQQWPSWVTDKGLTPDSIPVVLASLTPDEFWTCSLICLFLKVVILPDRQFGESYTFPF